MTSNLKKKKKDRSLWAVFFWHDSKEREMEQTSCFGVSSGAFGLLPGSPSGSSPCRQAGVLWLRSPGTWAWGWDRPYQRWLPQLQLLHHSLFERAAEEMAAGAAPAPWGGRGTLAEAASPHQWAVGCCPLPQAQHPFLLGSWRVGVNNSPQGTKNSSPAWKRSGGSKSFFPVSAKDSGGWPKARQGAQLWLKAAPKPYLSPLPVTSSVTGLASFRGRHPRKLFYPGLTALRFCLKIVSFPPSLVRFACRKGSQ